MESPPTAARDGAFLALALADALKLGLPDPDYITMHPHLAGRTHVSAVDFQFNCQRGRDPLPALRAWADRFGVTVRVTADSEDPASTWHKFEFTHAGVLFGAYAEIVAPVTRCGSVAPYSLAECALPDGHDGRHESQHQPAIVWDPVAVLAASIAAGTPVVVEDDAYCSASVRDDDDNWHPCEREPGHAGSHRVTLDGGNGGIAWSDREPVTGRDVLLSALADGAALDDDEPRHAARISNRLGPVTS